MLFELDEISCFLARYLRTNNDLKIFNYLDYFLSIGSSHNMYQVAQDIVIELLGYLGFYVSWAMLKHPS